MARHARRSMYRLRLAGGLAAGVLLVVAATVLLRAVPNLAPEPAAGTSSSPPAPVRPVTVLYEITGPGFATMTYTDAASRRVDIGPTDLPWVHDESAEPGFTAAAVSGVSADPKVRLVCRIYVDGKQVAGMAGLGSVSCVSGG